MSVEEPGEYKKEAWTMNESERENAIPRLKEEGNALFKAKDYTGAADKYGSKNTRENDAILRAIAGFFFCPHRNF